MYSSACMQDIPASIHSVSKPCAGSHQLLNTSVFVFRVAWCHIVSNNTQVASCSTPHRKRVLLLADIQLSVALLCRWMINSRFRLHPSEAVLQPSRVCYLPHAYCLWQGRDSNLLPTLQTPKQHGYNIEVSTWSETSSIWSPKMAMCFSRWRRPLGDRTVVMWMFVCVLTVICCFDMSSMYSVRLPFGWVGGA